MERQILTAYREQALNRLRNANVALWRTLPCQDGDNTIEVSLDTHYGVVQSKSKEFREFVNAAMSIACAEDAASRKVGDAAEVRSLNDAPHAGHTATARGVNPTKRG
jgi:hypothetical protein